MLDRSPFYRALHLVERCRTPAPRPPSADPPGRRERWLGLPGLADEAALARRLEAEGLTLADFGSALAEGPPSLGERAPNPPAWLAALSALHDDDRGAAGQEIGEDAPFAPLIAPLARDGRARAERGARDLIARHPGAPFDGATIAAMVHAEPARVEMPGLMVGLAGIGHGLLRLAAPDRVPSVLLLEA